MKKLNKKQEQTAKALCKAIKKERKIIKKYELEDMRVLTDLSIATISKLENFKGNPSLSTLIKVCDALELEITLTKRENQ
jgi:transcriptional regulator with XRE-family HTH domain